MLATGVVVTIIVVVCLSWAGTGLVLRVLTRRAVLDHPNERSSHSVPTPRGGGLAVIGAVLPAWVLTAALVEGAVPAAALAVAAAAAGLAAVSFLDDLRGLPVLPRLAAHAVAVAIGLSVLPADLAVFQGWVPPFADRLLAAGLWLWFVNLFNFMDGIDGITGVETVSLGGGLALAAGAAAVGAGDTGVPPTVAVHGMVLAGAALGFLGWNWHPARIFLGDVGSVPLGYLLGWLLLVTAAAGQWAVALVLPLYYLADASLTLIRRGLRGEKVWRAHREHYYQRAVQRGWSHARVVGTILLGNGALVLLSAGGAATVLVPWAAATGAVAVVALLLARLARA